MASRSVFFRVLAEAVSVSINQAGILVLLGLILLSTEAVWKLNIYT